MKIVITGTATTTIDLANDAQFKDWQIYSCNGAFHYLNRFDVHFELHDINYLKNHVKPDDSYFQFLHDCGDRLILSKAHPDFPLAKIYPLQEVVNFYNIPAYFNNTIAYMTAYALYMHDKIITDLALIGVDMASDSEYAHQRPCCEFYIGYAKGQGVNLHMPDTCPLLKSSYLYGFDPFPPYVLSSKQKLLEAEVKVKKFEQMEREAAASHNYSKGTRDAFQTMIKVYS